MKIQIDEIINTSSKYLEDIDYKSYDLFDALTNNFIDKMTSESSLFRRIAIQLNARSPIGLHFLGMKKLQHTKTISDLLWLNSMRYINKEVDKKAIDNLYNNLISKKSGNKYVWGLNFPYATRFIDAGTDMPNLYNTCTSGIAISYYYEAKKEKCDLLEIIYKDILSTFEYKKTKNNEGYFIYYPSQKHPTYNVNALALYLFTRINFVCKREVIPKDKFIEITNLLINNQLINGAWYYSHHDSGKWIDGFHTGFIIESLIYTYQYGMKDDKILKCINNAIDFYLNQMFTVDNFPKYFDKSYKYPIESQNCAQAIQTLSIIRDYTNYNVSTKLNAVVQNTINTLYAKSGFFYYKKTKSFLFRNSYIRWSTAPMLVALFYYKKSQ